MVAITIDEFNCERLLAWLPRGPRVWPLRTGDIFDQLLAVQLEGVKHAKYLATSIVIAVVRFFEKIHKISRFRIRPSSPSPSLRPIMSEEQRNRELLAMIILAPIAVPK